MKQQLLALAARVNALTLRERGMVFAAAAALLAFLAYFSGLGPLLEESVRLRATLAQQQNNVTGLNDEVRAKLEAFQHDPDAEARAQLATVNEEAGRLGEHLVRMQRGVVAPERMVQVLEALLRASGKLQLVSMKTLPVTPVNAASAATASGAEQASTPAAGAPAADNAGAAKPAAAPVTLLYRHGVELTVRGSYLDMLAYMQALEAMPTQVFWGGALLDAQQYPDVRLTLTVYTLSLDKTWLKL